jgi:hypothetical protein
LISPAGTKRVVLAHEDTVWVTVHINADNGTDLKKIEDEVIMPRDEFNKLEGNQMEVLL